MAIRRHGKALFADLQDYTGRIQIYVKRDVLGDDRFRVFRVIDVGDLLGVEGKVFRTHAGELTILVEDFVFLREMSPSSSGEVAWTQGCGGSIPEAVP